MKTYGEPLGRSRGIMKPVPMSPVAAGQREAFLGAAGSSLPPQVQRFVATKKTVEAAQWRRSPISNFTIAGGWRWAGDQEGPGACKSLIRNSEDIFAFFVTGFCGFHRQQGGGRGTGVGRWAD